MSDSKKSVFSFPREVSFRPSLHVLLCDTVDLHYVSLQFASPAPGENWPSAAPSLH